MEKSVYPDTKRPMQFCAAMVTGMPVYESTGVETKEALRREAWTQMLCQLTGELYMGCYSIGEPLKISYQKLLDLQTNLVLESEDTMRIFRRYFPTMPAINLAMWVDQLLDKHDGSREIEFKWMSN